MILAKVQKYVTTWNVEGKHKYFSIDGAEHVSRVRAGELLEMRLRRKAERQRTSLRGFYMS